MGMLSNVWERGFLCRNIIILLIVGFVARYAIGFLLTYTYDVHSWALIISNIESGNGLYDVSGYNYAPPWGYLLGAFSVMAETFGLDLFGVRVTEALPVEGYGWFYSAFVTSIEFNIAVKTLLFILDAVAGYILYWIVMDRTGDRRKAEFAFAIWFLCPFVIAVSSVGGMFDSLSAILAMACIVFVTRERYYLAGAMIGIAALMKLFPGILVFILIGYVLMRGQDDLRIGAKKVAQAMTGAIVIVAILLFPQILDGTLPDCFAFITSRATDNMGSGLGDIERYGTMTAYIGIILASLYLGFRTYRSRPIDREGFLLAMVLLNLVVLFLYPATPQYILLIAPFIIIQGVMVDRRYLYSIAILSIGTTMFAISANAVDLLSLAQFTDVADVNSVMDWIAWFQTDLFGISMTDVLYYGGAAIQYIGTLSVLAIMVLRHRDGAGPLNGTA